MDSPAIRVGMVGLGMIFDETYRPFFEAVHRQPLFQRSTGPVEVAFTSAASRTGRRGEALKNQLIPAYEHFVNCSGTDAVADMLRQPIDAVCIATPDDRHFAPAKAALIAGKHVLIEKPSVLRLAELDELNQIAIEQGVLAKVVYHKLLDPDHKKLRTLVADGTLRHVNNGYCSLLEPKSIALGQFSEWLSGRNPASYVAVHYLKLIDFTFGPAFQLKSVAAVGQRGITGTWDSVQLRVVYQHPDHRDAAFDIHTSWVTPDNFPGHVEQEVQFRFDNGVWTASQRRRGVELCVEQRTPHEIKSTLNNHYSADFLEPWGERSRRGYGVEAIRRFFEEVAFVEHGGPKPNRGDRLNAMRQLHYNDLSADRNVVAVVEALEKLLADQAAGQPAAIVHFAQEPCP